MWALITHIGPNFRSNEDTELTNLNHGKLWQINYIFRLLVKSLSTVRNSRVAFSKIVTIGILTIAHEDKSFREFNAWHVFGLSYFSIVCKIVSCWTYCYRTSLHWVTNRYETLHLPNSQSCVDKIVQCMKCRHVNNDNNTTEMLIA